MKKYIFKSLAASFLLVLLTACQDNAFLNQAPYSFTTPDNFYKTEVEFKNALVGCYEAINTSALPGGAWVPDGTYARGLYYVLEGCSDNVVATSANTYASGDFEKASYLPNNVNLGYFWQAYYVGISRCNYVIDKIQTATISDSSKTLIVSEARFMRAFYYHHLASCFGGVPLVTTSTPDMKAPRADLQSVYRLIVSDLEYAYQNLKTTPTYKSGAGKWAAGAYLGTVYNYLASCKRYSVGVSLLPKCSLNSFEWVNADSMSVKAVAVLGDVVAQSPYVLVSTAEYSYLFREATKSYQYKECLFLSEWSDGYSDRYSTITELFTPQGAAAYGGSNGRHLPTFDLYKAYATGDIRLKQSITGAYSSSSLKETVDKADYYVPANASATAGSSRYTGKFRLAVPGTFSNHTSSDCSLNYPLMRLADVKLQLAEALYFTNREPEARAIFTEIRQRVVDPTSKTVTVLTLNTAYNKADFVQELLDERRRELCFESKRRIDLIRFDKTTQVIQNLPVEGSADVQSGIKALKDNWTYSKIWLPIPQTEIDLNPNLVQNADY